MSNDAQQVLAGYKNTEGTVAAQIFITNDAASKYANMVGVRVVDLDVLADDTFVVNAIVGVRYFTNLAAAEDFAADCVGL